MQNQAVSNFIESCKDRLPQELLQASVSFSEGGSDRSVNFDQFLGSLNPVQLEFVRGMIDILVPAPTRSPNLPMFSLSPQQLAAKAKAKQSAMQQQGIQMSEREAINAVVQECVKTA